VDEYFVFAISVRYRRQHTGGAPRVSTGSAKPFTDGLYGTRHSYDTVQRADRTCAKGLSNSKHLTSRVVAGSYLYKEVTHRLMREAQEKQEAGDLCMANSCSRRDWGLVKRLTMRLPTVGFQMRDPKAWRFDRRFAIQRRMGSIPVVVVPKRG